MLSLVIITREVQKWKYLAFPVTVAWHFAGVTPSFLWYFATAILFMIDVLSNEVVGSVINTITGTAKFIVGKPKIIEKIQDFDDYRKAVDTSEKKAREMTMARRIKNLVAPQRAKDDLSELLYQDKLGKTGSKIQKSINTRKAEEKARMRNIELLKTLKQKSITQKMKSKDGKKSVTVSRKVNMPKLEEFFFTKRI